MTSILNRAISGDDIIIKMINHSSNQRVQSLFISHFITSKILGRVFFFSFMYHGNMSRLQTHSSSEF